MWNYLKSDFEELLNVVKEDSNVILEKLHDEKAAKKATAASQEAERRLFLEETYLMPLLYEEMDPAERGMVETYLADFKIDDRTDDISAILNTHDVVKEYFEALVPHEIPYEEFWSRYYFRCDEQRIQAAWDAQELAAQKARAELVGSVSSFLGGAAMSLASTVKEVVAQKDGRPPFVMNTAVDEDDDVEEEEEEELGWDDEDEEEEEQRQNQPTASTVNKEKALVAGENETDDSVDTEQIEFHDEALDKTKEELKQAVLERDLLQQTVELLKKELANSKNTAAAAAMPAAPPSSSLSLDVETLLKEKDTEIATLKASLLQMVTAASDAASNTSAAPKDETATVKVQELTQALAAKDREYASTTRALQDEIISLRAQLATSEAVAAKEAEDMKRHVDQSSTTMTALTTQLADARTQLVQAQAEVQQLRAEVEEHRHQQDSGDKTSEDSGVPVEAPRIVTATTIKSSTTTATTKRGGGNGDDDDDDDGETSDGWGDEW